MPTLCVFIDLHNINLLLYKSPNESWFEDFPYVYSKALFSSSFSVEEFFTAIFDDIYQRHGISPSDAELAITAFIEPPVFSGELIQKYNIKTITPVVEVLEHVEGYYPILLSNHSICTRDYCASNSTVRSLGGPNDRLDVEEENYYANLELYPQTVPTDFAVQMDIDANLIKLLDGSFNTDGKDHKKQKPPLVAAADLPIVFCGSRFSQRTLFKELDYLLMLNFIRNQGVFDIRRDHGNKLILCNLLNLHAKQQLMEADLPVSATVIASKSTIECAIQTDLGTSQLLQLEKNRILVIPTSQDERIKLNIKSRDIGNIETTVDGGNVGLIFDTRETKTLVTQDVKVFAMGLKSFKSAAPQTTEGFTK